MKPLKDSPTARVVANRSGVILDLEDHIKSGGTPPAAAMLKAGIRSILRVPLLAGRAAIGTLGVGSKQSNACDERHLRLAEHIGAQIAGAIANSQLNQLLRASQKRYQDLYENAPDMYVSVIPGTGAIIQCNQTCATALGYTKDEILGRPIVDLYHPDCIEDAKKVLQSFVETGVVTDAELQIKRKDGTKIDVSLNVSAVRDDQGNILYSRGSWRDITERKQVEEALRESNLRLEEARGELERMREELIRQERLRALGQMASGIAHDFNNTLTPILGFSELLLERREAVDDQDLEKHYLLNINLAAEDAAAVVRRLREFYRAREEGPEFLPVLLDDVILQALSLTQAKWKDEAQAKGATIRVETEFGEVPALNGNESELRQALTNLIFNAVDAMPEGGTITIRSGLDGPNAVLEVSDTGGGMSEEVKRSCLDPFFTTKGPKGTGMGLLTAYGIVRRHRGTLDIESEVGRGTTFVITLPIDADVPQRDNPSDAALPDTESLRILLVDDEPMVLEFLSDYLMAAGHMVETAINGREGAEKFRKGTFDLVVTDKAMPEMGGDEMASVISKEAQGQPIIMLTGFGDVLAVTDERPDGVSRVLSKPIKPAELLRAVREAMAGGHAA